MNFQFDRRGFLRFVGGGAVGAATGGIGMKAVGTLNEALSSDAVVVPEGPETFVPSVCTLCPAGCGLRVRKIGERAVRIMGNPLHPVNQGGLCPKGVAGLQALYHPDRLTGPLVNVGDRQSPCFEQTSWDKAIAMLSERLGSLRESGEAHSAVFVDRHGRSLLSQLVRRFFNSYGSPNYLVMPTGLDAVKTAVYLQQGSTRPVAYDLERTGYVLSFGANLLEGWGSPTSVMRAFGRWRDSSAGRHTKLVQIEPRFSMTAAKADEWVALRPGTEAALALGIAYVLITEGLYDTAFVGDHTFGFDDWRDSDGRSHLGFRSLVLSDYRLNDVAEMTDVPVEIILRLAREFAANRTPLAIGDHQTSTLTGDPYAAMAVHSLNALMGSVDAPGGVLLQADVASEVESPPEDSASTPRVDQSADHLLPAGHVGRLPEAIRSGDPYRVQALLLHNVNPVYSLPNGEAFREALANVPFVVSFTPFLDETSSLADLILPETTDLEQWQEASSPPAFPNAVQSVCPPAVEPLHDVRAVGDVLLEVSRAMGGDMAAALPFASFQDYLRGRVNELFAVQSGAVFSTSLEEAWNRLLARSGWWAPSYSSADELWEQMTGQGGWWEPGYYYGEWDRVLQTPSGRFEFYSQTLERLATGRPEFAASVGFEPGNDRAFLPHQRPLHEAADDYPLLLLPIEVLPFGGGEGGHLPYLQQISGSHLDMAWESWVEINPETASELEIGDGDIVWVESPRARLQARARHYHGARPGVVHMPLGYGHSEGSEWSRVGVNPLNLIQEDNEPIGGLPRTDSTFVRVYRS